MLLARALGPSDLWDQSQPKTISYTTDIVAHGGWHWLLPVERGELYATKPPLYNWMAAPFVAWLGFASEIAHKMPSVLALCGCWLLVVRLGRWLGGEALGWIAGLALVANYPMFKLGYLARPDMLLTLWMTLAWAAATAVFVREETSKRPNVQTSKTLISSETREGPNLQRFAARKFSLDVWTFGRLDVLIFWLCIALAGLTKGPPALAGVIAALVSARFVGGSWRAFAALRPIMGLTACALVVGAWVYGVWRLEPRHLWEGLWYNEIAGRVSGLGPEGSHEGLVVLATDLPHYLFYYIVRFAPWSLCAIAGAWALARRAWQRRHDLKSGRLARRASPRERWMISAAIFAATALVLFTFSAGKRADYIAIAFPSSALLAAWWLERFAGRRNFGRRRASARHRLSVSPPHRLTIAHRLTILGAAAALAILTWLNERESAAPAPGFGNTIVHFAREANAAIAADPMPIAFWSVDDNHVQALLGASQPAGNEAVLDLLRTGQAVWVVAGRRQNEPRTLEEWLGQRRRKWNAEAIVQTPPMPRTNHWPEQMTLYRVTAVEPRPRSGPAGETGGGGT